MDLKANNVVRCEKFGFLITDPDLDAAGAGWFCVACGNDSTPAYHDVATSLTEEPRRTWLHTGPSRRTYCNEKITVFDPNDEEVFCIGCEEWISLSARSGELVVSENGTIMPTVATNGNGTPKHDPRPLELSRKLQLHASEALSPFVQNGIMKEVLLLSLCSGRNALLYGAGGYGKSEMANAFLGVFDDTVKTWKTQLHIESTVASLYGGYDMKVLRDTGEEVFRVHDSLLDSHIAVLEEMLDAPPAVLASLKTTYTEGALLNGGQRVPSQNRMTLALTNKQPKDIANLGPSEAATMERFPIKAEIRWHEDTVNHRMEMYRRQHGLDNGITKVSGTFSLAELEEIRQAVDAVAVTEEYVAQKAAFVFELNRTVDVSPRMDIWADGVAKARAFLNGRTKVDAEDLLVLKYLTDMTEDRFRELYSQIVESVKLRQQDQRIMREIMNEYAKLTSLQAGANSQAKVIELAKACKDFVARYRGAKVLDESQDSRNQYITAAENMRTNALESI